MVTNERLIHRSGLVAKRSMEVPLNRINDVRFAQGVLERLIGADEERPWIVQSNLWKFWPD